MEAGSDLTRAGFEIGNTQGLVIFSLGVYYILTFFILNLQRFPVCHQIVTRMEGLQKQAQSDAKMSQ
jgi:hypothetical protein